MVLNIPWAFGMIAVWVDQLIKAKFMRLRQVLQIKPSDSAGDEGLLIL